MIHSTGREKSRALPAEASVINVDLRLLSEQVIDFCMELTGELCRQIASNSPTCTFSTGSNLTIMPKATSANKANKPRHTPLHVEIAKDSDMQKFGRVAAGGRRKDKQRQDEEDEQDAKQGSVVEGRMSRKILDLARDQQEELMGELDELEDDEEEEDEQDGDANEQRMKRPDLEDDEEFEEGDVSDAEYEELVSPRIVTLCRSISCSLIPGPTGNRSR